MAQINKPNQYFNTLLRNGTGSTETAITGVGFQPDFIWQKRRNSTSSHHVTDIVRGANELIYTEATTAEQTNANFVKTIDSDGFTMGSADWGTSDTVVVWNWLADNTSGSSNTDGSITSTVSANTTSGFSIATYTGTGANATVGHGLGSAPKIIFVKCRSNADNWVVYNGNSGGTKYLLLNANNAEATQSNIWNDTDATSSVFSLGTSSAVNGSTRTYVAYCFAEKKGYSKFGSYTGNGNANGTFFYTGFKPAFVMVKRTDTTNNWLIFDSKRDIYNAMSQWLLADTTNAEPSTDTDYVDFVSNGIKFRRNGADTNASGGSYIYMAFAENPLVGTNNIPATAR